MVKHHLLIIIAVLFSMTATTHAWWWSNNNDNEHLRAVQQQLQQQIHQNGQLEFIITILAIGVVVALVVGAAIGSNARKAVKEEHP